MKERGRPEAWLEGVPGKGGGTLRCGRRAWQKLDEATGLGEATPPFCRPVTLQRAPKGILPGCVGCPLRPDVLKPPSSGCVEAPHHPPGRVEVSRPDVLKPPPPSGCVEAQQPDRRAACCVSLTCRWCREVCDNGSAHPGRPP
eukprot:355546-Chlamydomonas_euryale.AAC.3